MDICTELPSEYMCYPEAWDGFLITNILLISLVTLDKCGAIIRVYVAILSCLELWIFSFTIIATADVNVLLQILYCPTSQ